MGSSSTETVKEIQEIRGRIDSDLDELGAVLPPRDEIVSQLAISALTGAVVIVSIWFIARRRRTRKEDRRVRRLVREALEEARDAGIL